MLISNFLELDPLEIYSGSSYVTSLGFEFFRFKKIGPKLVEFSSLRGLREKFDQRWPKYIFFWQKFSIVQK